MARFFLCGQEVCVVGNFDGQGGDDIAAFVRSTRPDDAKGDVFVALSDGGSFQPGPGEKWHDWFCVGGEQCLAGDFDGDGKDDIIAFGRDADPGRQGDVYVARSNSSSFQPNPGEKWHDFFCIGGEVCAVGDVNGDGKDDILTFVRDSNPSKRGNVYVALSSGIRFLPRPRPEMARPSSVWAVKYALWVT